MEGNAFESKQIPRDGTIIKYFAVGGVRWDSNELLNRGVSRLDLMDAGFVKKLETKICQRFPEKDIKHLELTDDFTHFCFPCGVEIRKYATKDVTVHSFTYGSGELYGTCLTFYDPVALPVEIIPTLEQLLKMEVCESWIGHQYERYLKKSQETVLELEWFRFCKDLSSIYANVEYNDGVDLPLQCKNLLQMILVTNEDAFIQLLGAEYIQNVKAEIAKLAPLDLAGTSRDPITTSHSPMVSPMSSPGGKSVTGTAVGSSLLEAISSGETDILSIEPRSSFDVTDVDDDDDDEPSTASSPSDSEAAPSSLNIVIPPQEPAIDGCFVDFCIEMRLAAVQSLQATFKEFTAETLEALDFHEPRCLIIVSSEPMFLLFETILKEVLNVVRKKVALPVPLECCIMHIVWEIPLPPPGKKRVRFKLYDSQEQYFVISRPPLNRLPLLNVSLRPLFECLGGRNVINLFVATLLEKTVIFVSDDLGKISVCFVALKALLFPLSWAKPQIQILHRDMLNVLEAPFGILAGIPRQLWNICGGISENRIVVDLDNNLVEIPDDEPFPTPSRKSIDRLWSSLKTQVYGNSNSVNDPMAPLRENHDANIYQPNKYRSGQRTRRETTGTDRRRDGYDGDYSEDMLTDFEEEDVKRDVVYVGASSNSVFNNEIRKTFLEFFVNIFGHYSKHVGGFEAGVEDLVNRDAFVRDNETGEEDPFLKELVQTQMMQVFFEQRVFAPENHFEIMFFDAWIDNVRGSRGHLDDEYETMLQNEELEGKVVENSFEDVKAGFLADTSQAGRTNHDVPCAGRDTYKGIGPFKMNSTVFPRKLNWKGLPRPGDLPNLIRPRTVGNHYLRNANKVGNVLERVNLQLYTNQRIFKARFKFVKRHAKSVIADTKSFESMLKTIHEGIRHVAHTIHAGDDPSSGGGPTSISNFDATRGTLSAYSNDEMDLRISGLSVNPSTANDSENGIGDPNLFLQQSLWKIIQSETSNSITWSQDLYKLLDREVMQPLSELNRKLNTQFEIYKNQERENLKRIMEKKSQMEDAKSKNEKAEADYEEKKSKLEELSSQVSRKAGENTNRPIQSNDETSSDVHVTSSALPPPLLALPTVNSGQNSPGGFPSSSLPITVNDVDDDTSGDSMAQGFVSHSTNEGSPNLASFRARRSSNMSAVAMKNLAKSKVETITNSFFDDGEHGSSKKRRSKLKSELEEADRNLESCKIEFGRRVIALDRELLDYTNSNNYILTMYQKLETERVVTLKVLMEKFIDSVLTEFERCGFFDVHARVKSILEDTTWSENGQTTHYPEPDSLPTDFVAWEKWTRNSALWHNQLQKMSRIRAKSFQKLSDNFFEAQEILVLDESLKPTLTSESSTVQQAFEKFQLMCSQIAIIFNDYSRNISDCLATPSSALVVKLNDKMKNLGQERDDLLKIINRSETSLQRLRLQLDSKQKAKENHTTGLFRVQEELRELQEKYPNMRMSSDFDQSATQLSPSHANSEGSRRSFGKTIGKKIRERLVIDGEERILRTRRRAVNLADSVHKLAKEQEAIQAKYHEEESKLEELNIQFDTKMKDSVKEFDVTERERVDEIAHKMNTYQEDIRKFQVALEATLAAANVSVESIDPAKDLHKHEELGSKTNDYTIRALNFGGNETMREANPRRDTAARLFPPNGEPLLERYESLEENSLMKRHQSSINTTNSQGVSDGQFSTFQNQMRGHLGSIMLRLNNIRFRLHNACLHANRFSKLCRKASKTSHALYARFATLPSTVLNQRRYYFDDLLIKIRDVSFAKYLVFDELKSSSKELFAEATSEKKTLVSKMRLYVDNIKASEHEFDSVNRHLKDTEQRLIQTENELRQYIREHGEGSDPYQKERIKMLRNEQEKCHSQWEIAKMRADSQEIIFNESKQQVLQQMEILYLSKTEKCRDLLAAYIQDIHLQCIDEFAKSPYMSPIPQCLETDEEPIIVDADRDAVMEGITINVHTFFGSDEELVETPSVTSESDSVTESTRKPSRMGVRRHSTSNQNAMGSVIHSKMFDILNYSRKRYRMLRTRLRKLPAEGPVERLRPVTFLAVRDVIETTLLETEALWYLIPKLRHAEDTLWRNMRVNICVKSRFMELSQKSVIADIVEMQKLRSSNRSKQNKEEVSSRPHRIEESSHRTPLIEESSRRTPRIDENSSRVPKLEFAETKAQDSREESSGRVLQHAESSNKTTSPRGKSMMEQITQFGASLRKKVSKTGMMRTDSQISESDHPIEEQVREFYEESSESARDLGGTGFEFHEYSFNDFVRFDKDEEHNTLFSTIDELNLKLDRLFYDKILDWSIRNRLWDADFKKLIDYTKQSLKIINSIAVEVLRTREQCEEIKARALRNQVAANLALEDAKEREYTKNYFTGESKEDRAYRKRASAKRNYIQALEDVDVAESLFFDYERYYAKQASAVMLTFADLERVQYQFLRRFYENHNEEYSKLVSELRNTYNQCLKQLETINAAADVQNFIAYEVLDYYTVTK